MLSTEDIMDEAVEHISHSMRNSEFVQPVIANYDEYEVQCYDQIVCSLKRMGLHAKKTFKFHIDLKNKETQISKPSPRNHQVWS